VLSRETPELVKFEENLATVAAFPVKTRSLTVLAIRPERSYSTTLVHHVSSKIQDYYFI
jgi:hypothetical protein